MSSRYQLQLPKFFPISSKFLLNLEIKESMNLHSTSFFAISISSTTTRMERFEDSNENGIINNSQREEISYYKYKWNNLLSTVLLILGIIGMLMSVLSLLFIILYYRHKLIRATSTFTSIMISLSLMMGNIPLFVLALMDPSPFACTTIIFCQSLCFGIIYASLMVKILRLLNVWYCSHRGNLDVRFASNNAVFVQTITISTFQVCTKFETLIYHFATTQDISIRKLN